MVIDNEISRIRSSLLQNLVGVNELNGRRTTDLKIVFI